MAFLAVAEMIVKEAPDEIRIISLCTDAA